MVSLDPRTDRAEFLGCFARVAETEERVVKTVIGGATAVGIDPPSPVRELAEACVRGVAEHAVSAFGSEAPGMALGVDITACCRDRGARDEIYAAAQALAPLRQGAVEKVADLNRVQTELLGVHGRDLAVVLRQRSFRQALTSLDDAYMHTATSAEYERLQSLVLVHLQQAQLLAGEVNARMDFGTHCRILGAPLIAVQVADSVVSSLDYSPNSKKSN